MASLLAASRQDLAAAYGLHARTETVRLGAAAFARLKCALWQSNPPLLLRKATPEHYQKRVAQAASAAKPELSSLPAHGREGQGTPVRAVREKPLRLCRKIGGMMTTC